VIARAAIALTLAWSSFASADLPPPPAVQAVRVEERVGAQVPPELLFSDASGKRTRLGELFDGERPVVLVMAYVRCEMLCSLVLQGTIAALEKLPLELGRDYRVVTVSIDHHEETASAAAKQREMLRRLGKEDATGWTFLVGAERPIRALADSIGFHFAWDGRTEQYAHPAVLFVLTPEGRVARYFHGIQYDPLELAASLRGAASGQLGASSIAESVLSCFRFDPALRAHRERIESYLQVGAAVVMVILASSVTLLFLWERRRRRFA
jgi:protein SCO1/2